MEQFSFIASVAAFAVVIICWCLFAGLFMFRKKPEASPDKEKAPRSFLGIALQAVAFALVWALHRSPVFSNFVPDDLINIVFQLLAAAISITSVLIAMSAIKELGKQWSFQARLIEDHKLVTSGVYSIVRHPIYAAMMGKLIATGIVLSAWYVLLPALLLFLIGTRIRTNLEERLLMGAFGPEFENWRSRVPGLIPFVKI
jgi:protein-S-isoprenylcysteine O-methyltransferase Ste14